MRRLVSGLRDAARRGRIFHLWWHPHNFARHPAQSFAFLHRFLDEFDRVATSEGMCSLSMRDVAASLQVPRHPAPRGLTSGGTPLLGPSSAAMAPAAIAGRPTVASRPPGRVRTASTDPPTTGSP